MRKILTTMALAALAAFSMLLMEARAATVTLTPAELVGLTITIPAPGVYPLDVVVTGPGGSRSAVLTVTVNDVVAPPTLTVEDASGLVGEPIPLTITASDSITITIPDGARLSAGTVVEPPPANVIILSPGVDVGALVSVSVSGEVFMFECGTYLGAAFIPKDGQTFNGQGCAILDGQGIVPTAITGTVTGVILKGLTVTGYNSAKQEGAIDIRNTSGWILEDMEVVRNNGVGVHLGKQSTVLRGSFSHNAYLGMGGIMDGSVIDGTEFAGNYTSQDSSTGESGAFKIWRSQNVTVRNICSHDNWGPGAWWDGGGSGNLVLENSTFFNNRGAGIELELTTGGVVRNNKLFANGRDNGWGGGSAVQIQNSSNIHVTNNQIEVTDGNGIFTIQQERGVLTTGNIIELNEIVFLIPGIGRNGAVQDFSPPDTFVENIWRNNTLVRPDESPAWYAWLNRWRTLASVQANGSEIGSTLTLEQRQPTQVQCPWEPR